MLTKFQRSIVDENGNTLPSAQVDVFIAGTLTRASLFSDSAGTTPLTNPINADLNGFLELYIAGGRYDIKTVGSGEWLDENIIEIVNDLTTGGTTKVLSAEQGKALQDTKVPKVASIDNTIVRFNGTTGEVQNSGSYITDIGNILVETAIDNGVDKLQVNGTIATECHNTTGNTTTSGVASGTYTPTITIIGGGGTVSVIETALWTKVGKVVTLNIRFVILDVTGADCSVNVSKPIASNIAYSVNGGVGVIHTHDNTGSSQTCGYVTSTSSGIINGNARGGNATGVKNIHIQCQYLLP